jgi:hypothetical protein
LPHSPQFFESYVTPTHWPLQYFELPSQQAQVPSSQWPFGHSESCLHEVEPEPVEVVLCVRVVDAVLVSDVPVRVPVELPVPVLDFWFVPVWLLVPVPPPLELELPPFELPPFELPELESPAFDVQALATRQSAKASEQEQGVLGLRGKSGMMAPGIAERVTHGHETNPSDSNTRPIGGGKGGEGCEIFLPPGSPVCGVVIALMGTRTSSLRPSAPTLPPPTRSLRSASPRP